MNYALPIFAVLLSFAFVYVVKPDNKSHFKLLLAFSGAFLLALTLFELFPSVYEHGNAKNVGLFVMLGILLQIILEFFSKGAEHGHVHLDKEKKLFPWLLFGSLCLHSFLEGFPIHHHNTIIYGILIHKVPIAIILSIFSLMTPLGSYIANHTDYADTYFASINALVIGVFLHISTVILFESSEGHTFNLRKIIAIIFGIAIAYFL